MEFNQVVAQLKTGAIVRGPMLPESVQVLLVTPLGASVKLVGRGLQSNQVHDLVLSGQQLAMLVITPEQEPFDGDSKRFKLGVEATRLGLAYEYDPYFSLSIARIDPLPHQLEAVYEYFLKLPRVRFLLADDPGAGKTIMAGLLIKELKIRGLVNRILIVTPANLTFQWQRELLDKFREHFEVVRGDVLRANYGSNPWQERNQVITSISWVSRVPDANESLLRSHWDLIIVDEAHKMSAYSADKKTLAYQLGEQLSGRTDHYLLMTATPHKGDPTNFALFLRLLDEDVYGDVKSLEEAMRRQEAPFYLRRIKEALVTFPDAESGQVKALFTKRTVRTAEFQIDADEWDFYDDLTHYVEEQSARAALDDSARGRAIGFTMAMLQRRFASSIYAARRSLERMKGKREKILADPEGYRQRQISSSVPDDFDELTEEEQQEILEALEEVVASVDPAALRAEIAELDKLIRQAKELEERQVESKLTRLRRLLNEEGVFADRRTKLLLFTEHKDTLDYLVSRLQEWELSVTQIHGGMKIGDRDRPGTRLHAERAFRDECQVMVATEAAGEGINLQFCWLMINYDIPWNPMRLEQRMGRIHRYGQEKDCLIFNFVATNTREGRVLQKLFERIAAIEADLDPRRTGKVFNVLGDVFPSNQLERMVRDMYARNLTEEVILSRIVEEVDSERFRRITHSTLEGLAKRELNLTAILGKSAEARERRLVPEVVEEFFVEAAPMVGLYPRETRSDSGIYRVGRVPRNLWLTGERLEPRFGRLGREYKQATFDKSRLTDDPTLEWVTPGHPLFETVRVEALEQVQNDLQRGAIFYDLSRPVPAILDLFTAAVRDGHGNKLSQWLFVVETGPNGEMVIRQPTIFLDLLPSPAGTTPHPAGPEAVTLPDREQVERTLIEQALEPWLAEITAERIREIDQIEAHVNISLKVLLDKQNRRLIELLQSQQAGDSSPLVAANLKQTEDRLDELNARLKRRQAELMQQRHLSLADIQLLGRAWVLPHPERDQPEMRHLTPDPEIERIAVQAAIAYEEAHGRQVQSVEAENRGFDLISRRPHPEDPTTAVDVRFIEVKGRAGVGQVALSPNEYRTAERLRQDYWLYVVYNCAPTSAAQTPEVHVIRDPARLEWQPVVKVAHYQVDSAEILSAADDQ